MKTTRLLGSQGGLRHSLRGSGRIKKSIVQGDKFEFAEKLKEKRNYILFVSGMGHETKEIEEINDFVPQAAPLDQLIEEREIIDNYNYLETKNIKKPPKIRSTTHHERLSIPIEKKTIKKFSTHTQSQPKSYAKTKTIKTTRFGKTLDVEEIKPYSSFTLKTEKNKSFAPSNLYETYKPNKNSLSLSKPLRTISTDDKSLPNSPKDTNQNKTITQTEKRINITKIGTREESPKNLPKYQPKPSKYNKPNRPETESNNKSLRENLGRNRPDDRKPPFGGSRPEMPRGGSAPRGGRPLDDNNLQRPEERRRPGSRPDKPGYGPKPGEKPEDRPRYGEPRTGPFGGPHGPNGPRPGDRSGPHGPNGLRPGERPGPFGGPHGPRPGERPRSGSQPKGRNAFDERTFPGRSGAPRPDNRTLPVKRPISQTRGGERPSNDRFKPPQKYNSLTEKFSTSGKKPNIGEVSRTRYQQTTTSSERGNNFNYYEDKNVVKQGRLNLPITNHHLRGGEDDGKLPQKYERNSSYSKASQKITSSLNKSYTQSSNLKNINNQKGGTNQGSKYTQKITYKKITTTTTNGLGGRNTGNLSGAGGIGAYTEYKKYEQKNKANNDTSQFNRSTDFRKDANSFVSKYQFADDDEFVVIDCPVHGKQVVKRSKLKNLGLIFN